MIQRYETKTCLDFSVQFDFCAELTSRRKCATGGGLCVHQRALRTWRRWDAVLAPELFGRDAEWSVT